MARNNYGSGTSRREKNGKWTAIWPLGDGRKASIGGLPSKREADDTRRLQLAILRSRRTGLPVASRDLPTLGSRADAWFARREKTHSAAAVERYKWNKHMAVSFSGLRPDEVTIPVLRDWVRRMQAVGQSPSSIRVMWAVLSGMFNDLMEDGLVERNPCRGLPPSLKAALRPRFDPKSVPYIQRWDDVIRIANALTGSVQRMYILCVYTGMRPAEARAITWADVDLAHGLLFVRRQADRQGRGTRPTKDKDSREVPILTALAPILTRWQLEDGNQGLIVRPMKHREGTRHLYFYTPNRQLAAVLERLGLAEEGRDWYACTRHTAASHFILDGGSIEELAQILGHSSIVITERYAHLRPSRFTRAPREHLGPGHMLSHYPSTIHLPGDPVAEVVHLGDTRQGKS